MMMSHAHFSYRPKDEEVHADTAQMNFARRDGGDHMTFIFPMKLRKKRLV